jgi:hypothetical protein
MAYYRSGAIYRAIISSKVVTKCAINCAATPGAHVGLRRKFLYLSELSKNIKKRRNSKIFDLSQSYYLLIETWKLISSPVD